MITLYHAPKSRSSRFIWLLEEIGEPYEVKAVAIRTREGGMVADGEEYRRIHPHGKVPAIVHDGVPVFESAAIALYLGDAFPRAKVGFPVGDRKRGPYVSWLAYYAGVMEPAFVGKALGFTTTNATTGWAATGDILTYVNATLAATPYLLGDQFTTADVLFGSTFALFRGSPLMPASAPITSYLDRITQRPAYQRAAAKDG